MSAKTRRLLNRTLIVFLSGYVIYALLFSGGGREQIALGPPESDSPAPRVLHPAPDLTATTLTGKRVSLKSFAEKTIVLNIWAPWCPPCRHELPSLDTLARLDADKAVVLLVATQFGETGEVVEQVRAHKIEHAQTLLAGDDLAQAFAVTSFPTTLIIDPQGIIRYRLNGPRDWASESARHIVEHIAACTPDGCPGADDHAH